MGRRRRPKTASTKTPGSVSPKRLTWWVFGFLVVVFAVKLVALLQLQSHPLLQPDGSPDSAAYVHLAQRVIGGDLTLGPGLYYVSPLYIYFLALTMSVGGGSLTFVRLVQIGLGTAAVGCVLATARNLWGRRAGWIAASLATLTGVVTFYEIVILQSALDTFLTAAALWALTRGVAQNVGPGGFAGEGRSTSAPSLRVSTAAALLSGVCFGLLTLNRPNSVVAVAGICLVLLAVRRPFAAALVTCGVCVALAPVVARNLIVSRQFALISSQGGLNLYIGNNANATGQYQAVPGVRANIEGQADDTRRVAEQAVGHTLTDEQVSSYFSRQAIAWMREHPLTAARLLAKKLALVLNVRHQWLDFSYPYYADDAGSILGWLVVGPWLLVPLGLTGLIGFGAWKNDSYGAWVSFVPFYAVSVAMFFVAERYRLPLFVPLCVGGGGAVDRLLSYARASRAERPSWRAVAIPALIFVSSAIVAFLPFRIDDGRYAERLRLSKVLMDDRDYAGAVRELEAATALRPADTTTEFNLGMALLADGQASEGVGHIRHAVDAGVPMPGARYALANVLLTTGDRDGAVALVRTFSPAPADSAESCYHVAVLALNLGDIDTARRFLRRALELNPDYHEAADLLSRIAQTK